MKFLAIALALVPVIYIFYLWTKSERRFTESEMNREIKYACEKAWQEGRSEGYQEAKRLYQNVNIKDDDLKDDLIYTAKATNVCLENLDDIYNKLDNHNTDIFEELDQIRFYLKEIGKALKEYK